MAVEPLQQSFRAGNFNDNFRRKPTPVSASISEIYKYLSYKKVFIREVKKSEISLFQNNFLLPMTTVDIIKWK